MRILADHQLPNVSVLFPPPFILSTYHDNEELKRLLPENDILICRSTLKVDENLLSQTSIQCVATASSGVDHVDEAYLTAKGIKLLDAKGCNARSVADYMVSTLAWLHQHQLLKNQTAGVIGGGKVGQAVMGRLKALEIETFCYDPMKAQEDRTHAYCELQKLYDCELLFIHANYHNTPPYPSKNLINEAFLGKLKENTIILNAARGGIVDENALLNNTQGLIYCTDVYADEPNIARAIVDYATLCTSHIAGHSIEGKITAVSLVSEKIHDLYGIAFQQPNLYSPQQLITSDTWDKVALSLYNPQIETLKLKAAQDLEQTFLGLRKKHQYRHDYNRYMIKNASAELKSIFGKI